MRLALCLACLIDCNDDHVLLNCSKQDGLHGFDKENPFYCSPGVRDSLPPPPTSFNSIKESLHLTRDGQSVCDLLNTSVQAQLI